MTTVHRRTPSASERLYRGQGPSHTQTYSHTRSRSAFDAAAIDGPWRDMTETFTWVAEQEFMGRGKRGMKTEDWVRQQQQGMLNPKESVYHTPRTRTISKVRDQEWEELIYVYEIEADQWMRQEERARRVALERERARLRIQEELRRIDARYQHKREADRLARDEARYKAFVEKERRDRVKLDKLILEAWANYEERWSTLPTSSEKLDFKTTPWPLILPPRDTEDITQDAIVGFLFSPLHSQDQSRKDRIRSAQLRWHPDRFRRFTARLSEEDKASVEEGVGIVARCLNELMEKEKKRAH